MTSASEVVPQALPASQVACAPGRVRHTFLTPSSVQRTNAGPRKMKACQDGGRRPGVGGHRKPVNRLAILPCPYPRQHEFMTCCTCPRPSPISFASRGGSCPRPGGTPHLGAAGRARPEPERRCSPELPGEDRETRRLVHSLTSADHCGIGRGHPPPSPSLLTDEAVAAVTRGSRTGQDGRHHQRGPGVASGEAPARSGSSGLRSWPCAAHLIGESRELCAMVCVRPL